MFGKNFGELKAGGSDLSIENRMIQYIQKLKQLDKKISEMDKKNHIEYVDVLNEQADLISYLEKNISYKTVNVMENYKNLLSRLESRKKEADLKLKKFKKECNERIRNLRETKTGKEEVKILISEMEDAEKSHDDYVEKIKLVEDRMAELKYKIEEICSERAKDSKMISKNNRV